MIYNIFFKKDIASGLLFFFVIHIFFSCEENSGYKKNNTNSVAIPVSIEKVIVDTFELKLSSFQKEVVSRGVIKASQYVDITFDVDELIEEIFVSSGQRVKKGQKLAKIRDFELRNQLKKIEHKLEQANLDFETRLISLGYFPNDTVAVDIPDAILKTVRLESNLDGLNTEKELISYNLNNTILKAPFPGVVLEMEAKVGNSSRNFEKLCTILDDRHLELHFFILEPELSAIRKGHSIKIVPLHSKGKEYTAKVYAISAKVDENGMIKAFATVDRADRYLLDGMNVLAYIQEKVPNQFVVPKTAVLDRQNKLVVFTYEDNRAVWNYVEVGMENSDSYSITKGLKAKDKIIYANNFNLAHLDEVIINTKENQ